MRKSVGVLVTYRDEKEMLGECLDSLFGQTDLPDEVIVHDDASSRPPGPYVRKGYPVRVIRSDRRIGLGRSRNVLMKASGSDYIHFQDADDLFYPEWCARIRRAIDRSEPDVILHDSTTFKDSNIVCERVMDLAMLRARDSNYIKRFAIINTILAITSTFRRELGMALGGFLTEKELPLCEDYEFHVRLIHKARTCEIIYDPLVRQRLRKDSLSADMPGCLRSRALAMKKLLPHLAPRYHKDLAEAAARTASALFKLGALEDAMDAFRFADMIGPPDYYSARPAYRILAKTCGPVTAERVSSFYRAIVPEFVRATAIKRGW